MLVNANGTVVNANTIALETFEAPGTALVGRGLLDLLPEFDSRLIPGSMRRPDSMDELGRTKPRRMTARRTDGTEFPVEVTSANLENGRDAYESQGFSGDELLMLVVRDLTGTMDTEAELARSQRQTEMILRAAAEGVVGTDTEGRVVLVNPAAAQILGYRASDLGGKELHPLVQHSRSDGEPFPYEESALADTLRSGRKHRVRGQVLWAKNGSQVQVDLTTAPVRDGDQLVGAVLAFTDRRAYDALVEEHATELEQLRERHAAEIARAEERYAEDIGQAKERYAALAERETDRHEALASRHAQLLAVLDQSLRGPLDELRRELGTLAADPAGQLWPEANQVLHHLAAGYARMTTLVDNVLNFQLLDTGELQLAKQPVLLDGVVAAGVDGAVELIGPGRAQFAVHAPPIEAEVDAGRLATALAHLIADVAGIDATGNARVPAGGGYVDSTIVVAAAQRGDVVRIEVRGPYAGGDPVHEPIVRGIVRAHGGVLQTHEVPGIGGSAYVLEVPIGAGAGAVAAPAPGGAELAVPEQGGAQGNGRRRARRSSVDSFLDNEVGAGAATGPSAGDSSGAAGDATAGTLPGPGSSAAVAPVAQAGPGTDDAEPRGRRRRRAGAPAQEPVEAAAPQVPAQQSGDTDGVGATLGGAGGTGRRRRRPSGQETAARQEGADQPAQGSVVTAAEHAAGTGASSALGETVPPQGMPVDEAGSAPAGRRARRNDGGAAMALPAAGSGSSGAEASGAAAEQQPMGRRARRALAVAAERAAAEEPREGRTAFALPPAEADRAPDAPDAPDAAGASHAQAARLAEPVEAPEPTRHDAAFQDPAADHTPPQPHPVQAPTGRRRARPATDLAGLQEQAPQAQAPQDQVPQDQAPQGQAPQEPAPAAAPEQSGSTQGEHPQTGSTPQLPRPDRARLAQPLPAEATTSTTGDSSSTQGRAISVRTLGQGVPFAQHIADQQRRQPGPLPLQERAAGHSTSGAGIPTGPGTSGGSGRRRKLGTRPGADDAETAQPGRPTRPEAPSADATEAPAAPPQPQPQSQPLPQPQPRPDSPHRTEGRSYAIGAPDEGAEGPEPLDGPNGAVEVANRPQPRPMDDELPPEPLDNPRRLLVWPAPDISTQQALSDRGYRPVIVHSRDEVDAQIAAFPAALFVDPLTGPITRTALQSLRQAAVAAEVPVLVTAGLGQATREAAYGADPAVLLKALAPRDSEQHPPRVLLIEEHEEIAQALTATLERRGMQVARAGADTDAVTLATQMRPNLVVMDLLQVRRRRAGIVDWLRANGQLNRTPLVVYTAAVDQSELPKLASGETVLFLAERSTSPEVQSRIVDLLAKIGTN